MRWHNIGDFTKNNVKDKDSFRISVVVQQLCAMFINYKDFSVTSEEESISTYQE